MTAADAPPSTLAANRPGRRRRAWWKKAGCSLVILLVASKLADLAAGGWLTVDTPRVTAHWRTREFDVAVTTNDLGLRERPCPPWPAEREDPAGGRRFRVLAAGDSFAAGYGVRDEEVFTRRMEDAPAPGSRRVATVNLGKPAAGPRDYVERLELALPFFTGEQAADAALVVFCVGNDLLQAHESGEKRGERAFGAATDAARAVYPNISRLLRQGRRARKAAKAVEREREARARLADSMTLDQWGRVLCDIQAERFRGGLTGGALWERFQRVPEARRRDFMEGRADVPHLNLALGRPAIYRESQLLEAAEYKDGLLRAREWLRAFFATARAHGLAPALVLAPSSSAVSCRQWPFLHDLGYELDERMLTEEGPHRLLREFAAAEGVACVDLLGPLRALAAERDDLYYEEDSHWTARGHEEVARVILRELAAAGFFSRDRGSGE